MDAREPFRDYPATDRALVELEEFGDLAQPEEALGRGRSAAQLRLHCYLPRAWHQVSVRPRGEGAWRLWSSAPPFGAQSGGSSAPRRAVVGVLRGRRRGPDARCAS